MPFPNPLILKSVRGSRFWRVYRPFSYESPATGWTIHVPMFYQTDLASVPWGFRNLFPKAGIYREAAVIHDFIYTNLTRTFTKKQADQIFLDGMKELGVPAWKRAVMYRAVRIGGRGNW